MEVPELALRGAFPQIARGLAAWHYPGEGGAPLLTGRNGALLRIFGGSLGWGIKLL